jgi:hypothetical protein
MVNTRARRRMGRYAAVAVIAAVAVGGLATPRGAWTDVGRSAHRPIGWAR